jgi:hypothetical protein
MAQQDFLDDSDEETELVFVPSFVASDSFFFFFTRLSLASLCLCSFWGGGSTDGLENIQYIVLNGSIIEYNWLCVETWAWLQLCTCTTYCSWIVLLIQQLAVFQLCHFMASVGEPSPATRWMQPCCHPTQINNTHAFVRFVLLLAESLPLFMEILSTESEGFFSPLA